MDTTPLAHAARFENTAEKQRRLTREAEMIAEADAEIAAGFDVSLAPSLRPEDVRSRQGVR
jgi:hypothetical protein